MLAAQGDRARLSTRARRPRIRHHHMGILSQIASQVVITGVLIGVARRAGVITVNPRALKGDTARKALEVYVSTADVDSCAAFSILKTMMRSDGIPFSAYPVSGYQELQNLGERLPKDGKNRSIVLINCGGTEDVVTLLGASHTRLGHPILSQSFAGISKKAIR